MHKAETIICYLLDIILVFLFFICIMENRNLAAETKQLNEIVKTLNARNEVLSAQNDKMQREINQLIYLEKLK